MLALKKGWLAGIIAVKESPLAIITDMRSEELVMKDGKVVKVDADSISE